VVEPIHPKAMPVILTTNEERDIPATIEANKDDTARSDTVTVTQARAAPNGLFAQYYGLIPAIFPAGPPRETHPDTVAEMTTARLRRLHRCEFKLRAAPQCHPPTARASAYLASWKRR